MTHQPISPSARFWRQARSEPALRDLVSATYMDAEPLDAARRFTRSPEFQATWTAIAAASVKGHGAHGEAAVRVAVDLGAGNGIASYALLETGLDLVYAVEPDPDEFIGRGAIARLGLGERCAILDAAGEDLPLSDGCADLVYARQVLHHASDLSGMVSEAARVLRPGGVFVAAREHVIREPGDLEVFLSNHPVHQAAGGEHAYQLAEYTRSIEGAGLHLVEVFGPLDSIINAYPGIDSVESLTDLPRRELTRKFGRAGASVARLPIIHRMAARRLRRRTWPGMPVTLVAIKSAAAVGGMFR